MRQWLKNRVRDYLGIQEVHNDYVHVMNVLHQMHEDAGKDIDKVYEANRLVGIRMVKEFAELKESMMRNMEVYNAAVAKLTEEVSQLGTVQQSAIALIQGMRERINSLIVESDGIVPVEELQKLSSALDVGTKALADAVAANTQPEPEAKPPEQPPAVTTEGQPAAASEPGDPNAPTPPAGQDASKAADASSDKPAGN